MCGGYTGEHEVKMNKVIIYSKPSCPACKRAKMLAETRKCEVDYLMMGEDFTPKELMEQFPGARTFPQIILNGEKIGGLAALTEMLTNEV